MSRKLKPKCIWTGNRDDRVIEVTISTLGRLASPAEKTVHVLPEHEEKLRDFNSSFVKEGRTFLYWMMGTVIMMPILVVTGLILTALYSMPQSILLALVGLPVALIGILMLRYPYSTPETVEWLGIKKSVKVVRWCGIGTIALGAAITLRAFL